MERRLFCLEFNPVECQCYLAGIELGTFSGSLYKRNLATCMCPKSAWYTPSKARDFTVRILLEFARQLKPFC
jgi:hypothetical protein